MQRVMKKKGPKITVYYDGACPSCVNDRRLYERLAGEATQNVHWFDITGQDEFLRSLGIDPERALKELHVKIEDQKTVSEIDAYILLMRKVPLLKPLARMIDLPLIRPFLSRVYHRRVNRRLKRSGRF
jgi:predicted DCC family thiol-disulfide oxidoreductase YuxK